MSFVTLTLKGEVKVARDVQERGWSTVEKQGSRIINICPYREYISLSFESELVCLYIFNSPFLSLVFTARHWFQHLI